MPSFIILFGWLGLLILPFDKMIGVVLPSWTRAVGIPLIIVGGIIVLVCTALFVTVGKGTTPAFDPPKEFVAIGPYRYVRNPIYIGGILMLAGFGLYHHSISILIYCFILFISFHLFVVFHEEVTLLRKFGSSYMDYKKRTNRWLPKWKKSRTIPVPGNR